MHNCPVCQSATKPITGASAELKIVDGTMRYFRCENCEAIHVPQEYHLSENEEVERYALHDNSDTNGGYRKYLLGVANSVEELVTDMNSRSILDYGAGKEFVLTKILREKEMNVSAYDPNYEEISKLDDTFNLIIACECVEHFRNPVEEFHRINEHLDQNGYCWVRTEMLESAPYFSGWWYKNDLTHIIFYSKKTMEYITNLFNWEIIHCDSKNTTLFYKR